MKRILFASDLTERSRRAADRARLLQSGFSAHLTALHVLEEDLPDDVRQGRAKEARQVLRTTLGLASDGDGESGSAVDVEVVPGIDYSVIVAKAEDCNLIVLGIHRARLLDAFIGTTAERVIRTSERPVLLVKNEAVTPYRRVAIATDLSSQSRSAAAGAAWLAPGAQFFLINAQDTPFRGYESGETNPDAPYDPEISAALDAIEVELPHGADERIVRIGDPFSVVWNACGELDADLIVLATRNRRGFARALLGNFAERLLAEPPCDILVVRAP